MHITETHQVEYPGFKAIQLQLPYEGPCSEQTARKLPGRHGGGADGEYEDKQTMVTLVRRVLCGGQDGLAELYPIVDRIAGRFLRRRLGRDEVLDRLHNVYLIVAKNILEDRLRDPARLPGFIATVAHRQAAAQIRQNIHVRDKQVSLEDLPLRARAPNPETAALVSERRELVRREIAFLPRVESELLDLFYLRGETADRICSILNLTDAQFRNRKSRAKSKLLEATRSRQAA
jgi:RNA polymerase sigma factor (sigma-70 family)